MDDMSDDLKPLSIAEFQNRYLRQAQDDVTDAVAKRLVEDIRSFRKPNRRRRIIRLCDTYRCRIRDAWAVLRGRARVDYEDSY